MSSIVVIALDRDRWSSNAVVYGYCHSFTISCQCLLSVVGQYYLNKIGKQKFDKVSARTHEG